MQMGDDNGTDEAFFLDIKPLLNYPTNKKNTSLSLA